MPHYVVAAGTSSREEGEGRVSAIPAVLGHSIYMFPAICVLLGMTFDRHQIAAMIHA